MRPGPPGNGNAKPPETGKACLYVGKLGDIHLPTLKKLIRQSAKQKPAAATA